MAERPENSDTVGLWHEPTTPNPWQQPEDSQPAASPQIVDALPEDMSEQPVQSGGWHLPKESETTLKPGDKVELEPKPATSNASASTSLVDGISPEDMINQILASRPRRTTAAAPLPEEFSLETTRDQSDEDAALPEDFDLPQDSGDDGTAADDGMAALEALGSLDDDDDEAFMVSEYLALASLEEASQQVLDEDSQEFDVDDLTPAQRALLEAARNAEEELPTALGDEDLPQLPVDDERTVQLEDETAGTDNPASVAAEMAARFASGDVDTGFGQGTQPYPTGQQAQMQLTPAEQQLAEQFRETRRQVTILRQQHESGQITYDDLQRQLSQLTILDETNNVWWMIGYETDSWYRYDNATGQWIEAQPPVPLQLGGPATATGEFDPAGLPNELEQGSLPYLPDDQQTEYSDSYDTPYDAERFNQAQQDYEYNDYIGEDTPIPRPGQPAYDPNLTQVNENVFDQTRIDSFDDPNDTLIGDLTFDDEQQTMPSATFGGGETAQSYAQYEATYDDVPDYAPDYNTNVEAPVTSQTASDNRRGLLAVLGVVALVAVALVLVGGIVGFAVIMSQYNSRVEPFLTQIEALAEFESPFQDALIVDANGDPIAELISGEGSREEVSITDGEVSPYLIHAIVSSEDETYYENAGFSSTAVIRAFLQNLGAGDIESGASTITQQVARRLVTEDNTTSADRKLTEIFVALKISELYDKNEILDLYLNDIFFGEQSYGVEAASQFYFDKPAADLNMAEAAMLAGIIPQPNATNPVANRVTAAQNMRIVMERMVDVRCLNFQHGQWADGGEFCVDASSEVDGNRLIRFYDDGRLFDDEGNVRGGALVLQIAMVEGLPYERRGSDLQYPHFVNYVLAQVENVYGPNFLFERGATIRTTLIPRIQNTAEESLARRVDELQLSGVNTGAVIVTDPQSGAIRAMVGSPDFNNEEIAGQVNNTLTPQQPGSAIKPIVYAGALDTVGDDYYTPITILWDVPSAYSVEGGQEYRPTNFDGQFSGPISVRRALQNSLNVPAVKAYAFIGTPAFQEIAARLGINFAEGSTFGLPSALGANDTYLLDMARAYGTIANDGVNLPLYAIESITDSRGNPVSLPERQQPSQALQPGVAYLLQNILSDDPAREQEFGRNSLLSGASFGLGNQNVVAAKTGTSDGARDLWTMGFTNNFVVGVWLGTVDNSVTRNNLTGASAAAPVWHDVMAEALNNRDPGVFDVLSGVQQDRVCALTGTLVGPDCPNITTDIFLGAQPPPPPEEGFVQTLVIDTWTNRIANNFCPDYTEQRTFANIEDPFAVAWLNSAAGQGVRQQLGLPQNLVAPPTEACSSQGQIIPNIRIVSPGEDPNGGAITVSGELIVTGIVAASNLQSWQLQIAQGQNAQGNFQPIMSANNAQVTNVGELMTYDTRQQPNAVYTLRLFAISNDGGFATVDRNIRIENVQPTATPAPVVEPTVPVEPLPFDNSGSNSSSNSG